MKKARVVSKYVNSQTDRLELRAGAKGKGRVLAATEYWPAHYRSCDAAYEHIYDAARREGVEVVSDYSE